MKMGIQKFLSWIPASAGMTNRLACHSLQWQDDYAPQLCRAMIARELFYALPLALMLLLALTPGISFTEDLGRHLLLGKIIVTTGHVPNTNFLTYTYPDFPFINHHWLSEVVFYLVHRAVGLNGLILLKALLMCATLALAMRSVPLIRASPLIGFAAALAAVALGYRTHIRPELFTYFGVALYGWLIARAECSNDKKLTGWNWAGLIAYGWFWANAHIYFMFGIGMIFSYWLACWWQTLRQGKNETAKGRTGVHAWPRAETFGLIALICISLLNPNGWRGLLYPLGIFGNYGIAITENASPLSYWETVINPMLFALPLLTGYAVFVFWRAFRRHNTLGPPKRGNCSVILNEVKDLRCIDNSAEIPRFRRRSRSYGGQAARNDKSHVTLKFLSIKLSAGRLAEYIILFVALIAAWRMARNVPLLALTLLPALGYYTHSEMTKSTEKTATTKRGPPISKKNNLFWQWRDALRRVRMSFSIISIHWSAWLKGTGIMVVIALNLWLAFAVVGGSYSRIFPSPIGPTPFGFDDESRYLALRRLRADGLPGKVFSDYNSGSLVEYNIYPERGYVDNRPEAFPEAFWKQEYEPALALGAIWEDMIARRGIQTVAVSTAGVKELFIRALLADSRWQLVHLDFFYAVFTRNTPGNQDFLRRHAFGRERIAQFAQQTAQRICALSSQSIWRRQVLADQIVYEIYGLICLGANDLAWPLVWDMHLRYPDYQLIHELMRVSAPPYAAPAVMDTLARRARWPLAAKQVLDWGTALEAQGRMDKARAVYRRGQRFFPLSPNLPPPAPVHSSPYPTP